MKRDRKIKKIKDTISKISDIHFCLCNLIDRNIIKQDEIDITALDEITGVLYKKLKTFTDDANGNATIG